MTKPTLRDRILQSERGIQRDFMLYVYDKLEKVK